MQKSLNSPYNRTKPNLTLNLKYILNQDQLPPTLKSSPHINQSQQRTAVKTPTEAKYAPLRRTPPSTLRKKSLSSTSPQKNSVSSQNLSSSQRINLKNIRNQKFQNFNKSDQQCWNERAHESYQFDQLSAQKTPEQFGRQSIMTEHQHPHIQFPRSTRHNQVHLSTGSAITTSIKGLRNLNHQNVTSQSSLGSVNNSLQKFQQSSTYSSKKEIGPKNISIAHSASGCTTPGGHLALTSVSLSEKAKKQAQKAQMVSEFRQYGITHTHKNSTSDQNKTSSPTQSIKRANQQQKALSSSSSSTANKNPLNTPQTGYDRERQRHYQLGAFPSGGRRIPNHGIRMSRGQLTEGSPASSSTTMSPPRNNLAFNRSSFNAGGNHLATIASSDQQQQEQFATEEQKQHQRQVEQLKLRKGPNIATQTQLQCDQQPLPSSRSQYSQMTERQRFHYQAYEQEFEQNFGRNPHLHSKYIDQIISKMDQKFQTLGAMTRDFEDNQCDLLLFKNKLYRVISDVQNDLRQSANIIHILTQDRIRLKEIFCKQGIELQKMKEALNELKQLHQRIFKQKSIADQSIESLLSQIAFYKNQSQKIVLITHEQANEIARLKRILNQKQFEAEASGMMQQKDMTSLLRQNQQLRQQLENSLLERTSSNINNRINRASRIGSRAGGGGGVGDHIHNQTATAAEILNNINTMRSRSYRPLEGTRSALSVYSNYSSLAPNTNRSDFSPNRYFEAQPQHQYTRGGDANTEGRSNFRPYSSCRIQYDTSVGRSHSASKKNSLRRVQQAIQNMLHLMDVDVNSKAGSGKSQERSIQNQLNVLLNRRYSSFQELYQIMNSLLDRHQGGRSKLQGFNPNKNHVHQIMTLFCKIIEDNDEGEDQDFNLSNRRQKNQGQGLEQRSRQAATSPLQHQNQSYSKPRPNRITVGVSPRNSSPRQSVTQCVHAQQNFPNQNQSQIIQSPSKSMSHWDSPFKAQNTGEVDQDEENNLKRKSKNNRRLQEQQIRIAKTNNLTNISQSDLSRQLSVAMKNSDKLQNQSQQQPNIIQKFPDTQYNTVSSIEQSQSQILRGGITHNDKNLFVGSGMTLAQLKDLLKKEVIAQIIQQQQNTSNHQQMQSYKNLPQQFHNLHGQSGEISFHSSFNFDSQSHGIRPNNATKTQRETAKKDQIANCNNTPSGDEQRSHSYLYSSSKQFTEQLSLDQYQLQSLNQQKYGMSGNKFLDEMNSNQVAIIRARQPPSGLNQQLEQITHQNRLDKRQLAYKVDSQLVTQASNKNNQQTVKNSINNNNNNVATPSSSSTEQATNLIKVRTRSDLSNNQSDDGQQYLNVEYQQFDPDQLAASGGLDTPDYGENKAQAIGGNQISADPFSSSEGGIGTFIPGSRLNGSQQQQQYQSNSQQSLDLASSGILGSINPLAIRSNQQLLHQIKSEVSVISEKSESVNTFLGQGAATGNFQSQGSSQYKLQNLHQQLNSQKYQNQQIQDLGSAQGGTFNTAQFNSIHNQKFMSSRKDQQNNNETQKTQELPQDDSLFTISQSQITPKNYSQSNNIPHYNKNPQTVAGATDISKLTASQISQTNVVKNIDFAGVSNSNISRHEDDSPQPIQPDSGTASMLLPHMAEGSLNVSAPPSQDSQISNSAQMHIMAVRVGSPPPPRKDDQLEHASPPRVSSKNRLKFTHQNQEQYQQEKRRNQQLIIEATQGVKIVSGQQQNYDIKKRPQMLLQEDWEMPDDAEFEGSLRRKTYNSSIESNKQNLDRQKNQEDQTITLSFRKQIEKNLQFGQKNKTPQISKFITPKEQDDTLMVSADTISPISVRGIVTPQQHSNWQKRSGQREYYKQDDYDEDEYLNNNNQNTRLLRRQQRSAGLSGGEGNKTAIFYQEKEHSYRNSSKQAQQLNSPGYLLKQQSSSQTQNTTQQSISEDFHLLKDIKKEDWPANFYLQKTSQHQSFSDDASFNHLQNLGSEGNVNKLFKTPQGIHDVTPLVSSITREKNMKQNAVIEQGAEEDEEGTPLKIKSRVSEFSETDKQSIQSGKLQDREKKKFDRIQKARNQVQRAYGNFSHKNSSDEEKVGKVQNVDDIFQIANLRESGSKMHISKNLMKKNVERVSEAKARLSFSNQGAIRHSNNLSSQNKLFEIKKKLQNQNKQLLKGKIIPQTDSIKRQNCQQSDANQEEIQQILQQAGKRNQQWKQNAKNYQIQQSKIKSKVSYIGNEGNNADDEYDQDDEDQDQSATTLKYRKNRIPSLVLQLPYKKREHSAQQKNHMVDKEQILASKSTKQQVCKKTNNQKIIRKSQQLPKNKNSTVISKSSTYAGRQKTSAKQNLQNKSLEKSIQPQPSNYPKYKPHKKPSKPHYFTFQSQRLSQDHSLTKQKTKTASVSPNNHQKNKLTYTIPQLAITSRNSNMVKTPRSQRHQTNKSIDTRATSLIGSGISNIRSVRASGGNPCKSPYSRQTTIQGHCSVQRGSTATAVQTDSDFSNESQKNKPNYRYHHHYHQHQNCTNNRFSIGSGGVSKNQLFNQSLHQHSLSHTNNIVSGVSSFRSNNLNRNSVHLIQDFQNSARFNKEKRGVESSGSQNKNGIFMQYSDILQRGPTSPSPKVGASFHVQGGIAKINQFQNRNQITQRQKMKQQFYKNRKDQSYNQGKSTSMILSKKVEEHEAQYGNKIVEQKTIAKLRERVISPRYIDDGIMNIEAQAKVVTKWNRRDDPYFKLRRSVKHITDPNRKSTPDLSNIVSRVDTGLKKGNTSNQDVILVGGRSHTSRDHTPTSMIQSKTGRGGDQSNQNKSKTIFQPVRSSRGGAGGIFGRKSSTRQSKQNLFGENICSGQEMKSSQSNYKRQETQSSQTGFFGPGSGQNNSAQNLSSQQLEQIKKQQPKIDVKGQSKTPRMTSKAIYTFGAGGVSRNKTPTKMRTPTNFRKSTQASFLNTSSNISALNNTGQHLISGGAAVFGERKSSANVQPTSTATGMAKSKKTTKESTGSAIVHSTKSKTISKKSTKTEGAIKVSTITSFKQRKHSNF